MRSCCICLHEKFLSKRLAHAIRKLLRLLLAIRRCFPVWGVRFLHVLLPGGSQSACLLRRDKAPVLVGEQIGKEARRMRSFEKWI